MWRPLLSQIKIYTSDAREGEKKGRNIFSRMQGSY